MSESYGDSSGPYVERDEPGPGRDIAPVVRELLDSTPYILLLLDETGRLLALNDEARRVFRGAASAGARANVLDSIHGQDRPQLRRGLAYAASGRECALTVRVSRSLRRSGEPSMDPSRWIEVKLVAAPEGDGVLTWGVDVTEHRAVVEELRHRAALLSTSLRERELALGRLWTQLQDERRRRSGTKAGGKSATGPEGLPPPTPTTDPFRTPSSRRRSASKKSDGPTGSDDTGGS